MTISGIYIDDSGNPGSNAPSAFLPESRKSWASVIIPEEKAGDIEKAMKIFLGGIKQEYGLNELHFTDIYSGRGIWKKVSVEKRKEIFDLMTMIVSGYNLPIFYQTYSDNFRKDHTEQWSQLSALNIKFWNFKSTAHISLFLILIQLRDAIPDINKQSDAFKNPLRVIVDAGLAKESAKIELPFNGRGYLSDTIEFENSESFVGLQLADFVAFVISKSQRIMFEKKPGEKFLPKDIHILNIVSKLNHWSLKLASVNQKKFSKEGYEFFLKRDRMNKSLDYKIKNIHEEKDK